MPRPMRFSPEVRARVDHCAASSTRASRRCGERSPGGSRHHAPPGAPTSAASPLAECVIGLYKTELTPSTRAMERHRRGGVRDAGVGRVVQHASPARAARLRSAGRVRASLLQPPGGFGRAARTHVTESPGNPARFRTFVGLPLHRLALQEERLGEFAFATDLERREILVPGTVWCLRLDSRQSLSV
jgi:hypothetical protein